MNSVLNKSKPQLIKEIEKLQERIQELEQKESKRINMENALAESEELFRQLAEQSPNMIFINQGGKVVYANKKSEEVTGYSKNEFYSPEFDFKVLIQPEYLESLMENFKKHMEGKDVLPLEYAIRTRNGERVEVIINTKLIKYGEDKAILGIITDITERKKAEKEIERLSRFPPTRIRIRCLELIIWVLYIMLILQVMCY